MHSQAAPLHAGLLARKGEARPSAAQDGTATVVRSATVTPFAAALPMRREVGAAADVAHHGRRIELPRDLAVRPALPACQAKRRQIHARLEPGLHLRVKIAAAKLGRTQQDLVASAIDAYLPFIEEDVLDARSDARNAGD